MKTPLKFILLWTIATFGGFLGSLFWVEVGEQSEIGLVQAAIGGLAIALPQSLILRENISIFKWVCFTLVAWVLITAIGVGAIGWVVPSGEILPLRLLYGAKIGVVGGLALGIAQCLAIRQPILWTWQWILVNSFSWAIAIPIGTTIGFILCRLTHLFLGEVAGLAMTWLVVAILTGINAYKLDRGVGV
ncbi:conserved hypothetical protein [Trichormus variabilis ATCC 29413]|uniref:Uncharacterized protein n=2 Tax=Anabaena variabilis TaxID=264691 RepID=Q3MA48_TRIV2|nr:MULTISPECIES: hypothetical protein [Nostocaceae]ABA22138.1 conserved hypothetical protein [Trichormus variabilis ATCC 29413]MBC1216285.1 hypothetical protein [Trichormus variabilis ARAD]MBC1258639.1 hypothetical protein [Trichormus variabilis V5]MBC1270356.1 hypothetical protein [Trichormus variabilis FSR]MBC1302435.1 hypothetical protein [Trichormus variabilis N2B]